MARYVAKRSKFWQLSALESRKYLKNIKIKNLIFANFDPPNRLLLQKGYSRNFEKKSNLAKTALEYR